MKKNIAFFLKEEGSYKRANGTKQKFKNLIFVATDEINASFKIIGQNSNYYKNSSVFRKNIEEYIHLSYNTNFDNDSKYYIIPIL